ncbi:MAG: hypothetical protein V4676_11185 [Bacteroidota bacterium]
MLPQKSEQKKPDKQRGRIGFAFAIIIGLSIGIFIKRVHIGLMIGLAIGLLSSVLVRRR